MFLGSIALDHRRKIWGNFIQFLASCLRLHKVATPKDARPGVYQNLVV